MNNRKNQRIEKELTKTLIHKFYFQTIAYAGLIIALFGIGYVYCSTRIWYEDMMLYPLIHFLHYNWFTCFLMIFVTGVLLLTFSYFRKFIWILEHTLEAVDSVAQGTRLPEMPAGMAEVQRQLESIQQETQDSRRQAKEAEQRRSDLIVYMAHDLKTPLTSVIGYLTLLKEEKEISSALQEKYMGIALKKAERLEELVNELFEITRFNLSHMVLEKSRVNLGVMLEQMSYEFAPQLEDRQLSCQLHLEPELFVYCDVDKIERVFDNLFRNAMHYGYAKTVIHICAYRERDGTYVRIEFKNFGKTIPPEQLSRIFEQFYRLDGARDSTSGGAGLGLAIAKEIMEAHGGSISCSSEDEEICFHLTIPVSQQFSGGQKI